MGNQGENPILGLFFPIFIPGPISGPIWLPISGRRPETYFLAGCLDRNAKVTSIARYEKLRTMLSSPSFYEHLGGTQKGV